MMSDEQRQLIVLPPPGESRMTFTGVAGPGTLYFVAEDGSLGEPVPEGYVFTEPPRLYLICEDQPVSDANQKANEAFATSRFSGVADPLCSMC